MILADLLPERRSVVVRVVVSGIPSETVWVVDRDSYQRGSYGAFPAREIAGQYFPLWDQPRLFLTPDREVVEV